MIAVETGLCPGCLLDENHTPPDVAHAVLAYVSEKSEDARRERLRHELEKANL